MQPLWRFINTGAGEAARNMALDEALLLQHEAGAAPPTLRVYGWCPPTLSLGYAQNARQEVDLVACQAQGVAVVRRPTGGRAVLHDQEVTYSVVMPLSLPDGSHTITEHYRRIGLALAAALQALIADTGEKGAALAGHVHADRRVETVMLAVADGLLLARKR